MYVGSIASNERFCYDFSKILVVSEYLWGEKVAAFQAVLPMRLMFITQDIRSTLCAGAVMNAPWGVCAPGFRLWLVGVFCNAECDWLQVFSTTAPAPASRLSPGSRRCATVPSSREARRASRSSRRRSPVTRRRRRFLSAWSWRSETSCRFANATRRCAKCLSTPPTSTR